MKIDKDTETKLQEMQMLEQNFQNFLLQKQAFEMEFSETESSLEEIKKSDDDVYKISGSIMIKAKKDEILKELEEKKKVLNLRIKSLENQENHLREKLEKLRSELEEKFKDKN